LVTARNIKLTSSQIAEGMRFRLKDLVLLNRQKAGKADTWNSIQLKEQPARNTEGWKSRRLEK